MSPLVGWLLTYQRQRWRIRALERSNEEIQVEENLVFDFLHGLGEAFRDVIRPHDLHRLIVESSVRILDAHGGALYMADRTGTKLDARLSFQGLSAAGRSARPHPAAGRDDARRARKLSPLPPDPSPAKACVGRVWKKGEAVLLADLADAPELSKLRDTAHGTASVMVAPVALRPAEPGRARRRQRPDERALFRRAISSSSNRSPSNPPSRSTTRSSIRRRTKRSGSITTCKSRATSSASFFPRKPPAIDGFDIAGINIPARQVSGDYFDYIKVDDDRLGVVIADVSGKGVPASLIMAICRSVLRAEARLGQSPAEVLRKVNRQLYPDIKEDMFISMAYVILDHKNNHVTLSRGGHDAPLLYRAATGEVEVLKPPGMALGIDSGDVFDRITGDLSVPLERDDCLVLYTDGVTEALDANGDEFGPERMIQSIRASASEGAPGVITA